ncbi:hypothetical protein OAM48_05125 [Flavobacteriaceae bacterium]|jgi:uncharacterized membrane protein YhdT|nr:hypothetical protein [Flavobacteriaceae bacterium]MDC0635311.1 hypothetical protein [Flavobacteriaceae bacterium]CAI8162656.1 MAG: Uncharacterised protein [Formosa sp. Hel3_A1_48]|tara:strand:- start:735 stop:1373 length:639 start_codon:yes stop_codon:yes gene_type:complete
MDELELLKKDWQENQKFPKLSKQEIYALLHKKSSSIVKWIFILSLIEFGFWTVLALFMKDTEAQQRFDSYEMDHIMIPFMVIGYLILGYFFVTFYKNYKKISSTDSVKLLMKNILNTRKTVKQYVLFNLVFIYISLVIGVWIEMDKNPDFQLITSKFTETNEYLVMYGIVALLTLLMMVALTGILLGFYYLVYGILLKRLKKNYKVLKEIEG